MHDSVGAYGVSSSLHLHGNVLRMFGLLCVDVLGVSNHFKRGLYCFPIL